MNLTIRLLTIAPVLILMPSSTSAGECIADKTSKPNEIYWINDANDLVPLKLLRDGIFNLSADDLGRDRNLRFVGHMKSYSYISPAVVKVVGWSKSSKMSTPFVYYFRGNKSIDDKSIYPFSKIISLFRYQKHHRSNGKEDDKILKRTFHFTYNDRYNSLRSTDDTLERRKTLQFEDVPKIRDGGLFARLLSSTPSYANEDNENYVYLKAALFDLKTDPCFSFTVRLPKTTERLVIVIEPIEADSNNPIGRKRWELRDK